MGYPNLNLLYLSFLSAFFYDTYDTLIMKTKQTIAIVEDHDSIRMLLAHFLSKDYVVITIRDGMECLRWLQQGVVPDAILLDIGLPGLSGLELLATLRWSGLYHHIPIVILSAINDSDCIEQCTKLGIEDYIEKPFNPIQLKASINDAIIRNNDLYKQMIQN